MLHPCIGYEAQSSPGEAHFVWDRQDRLGIGLQVFFSAIWIAFRMLIVILLVQQLSITRRNILCSKLYRVLYDFYDL